MAETLPVQARSLDMPVDCPEISGLDRAVFGAKWREIWKTAAGMLIVPFATCTADLIESSLIFAA